MSGLRRKPGRRVVAIGPRRHVASHVAPLPATTGGAAWPGSGEPQVRKQDRLRRPAPRYWRDGRQDARARHQGRCRKAEGRPGRARGSGGCDPALERSAIAGSRHAVGANDPGCAARWNALARCVLSGLRNEPGHRSAHPRPSPAGLGRHAGAWPAVLLVPRTAPMPKLLGLYALPPAKRQGVAL
jgi:hypothetical protein